MDALANTQKNRMQLIVQKKKKGFVYSIHARNALKKTQRKW